jgi:hypothetical protein
MSQKIPRPVARNEPNRAGSEYLGGSSDPKIATANINIKPNSACLSGVGQNDGAKKLADALLDTLVTALASFRLSKTSAALHEAGHCVIGALQGHTPSMASIWPVIEFGHPQWIGRTDGIPKWRVDDGTPPEKDLKQAQSQLAGVVSEALFDGNFRLGSFIEELLTAQAIVLSAAVKLQRDFEHLWLETLSDVAAKLKANAQIVREIADVLMCKGSIKARRLTHLLRSVKTDPLKSSD